MANAVRSTLLQRIANYFTEWDGDDRTAPVMQLNIHELRDIASMHVELCRLLEDKNKRSSEAHESEMRDKNDINKIIETILADFDQRIALWNDKSVQDRESANKHIGTWIKAKEIVKKRAKDYEEEYEESIERANS